MTDINSTTAAPDPGTNAATADIATQRDVLPLRSLQLIGVFGTEDARRALLRNGKGDIASVQAGDKVGRRTVLAIDVDAVILSGTGGSEKLTIPAPDQARIAA